MKTTNSKGISFEFLESGAIRSIEVDPIRISLTASTPFSKSGSNLYLRKRSDQIEYKALLGPQSNSTFKILKNKFIAKGSWDGLDYICTLQLSERSLSWQWIVEIDNKSGKSVELDIIYLQDIGLRQISDDLVNEYYVSQYIERRILWDANYGSVICCRQNMKEPTGNPWIMIACENNAIQQVQMECSFMVTPTGKQA